MHLVVLLYQFLKLLLPEIIKGSSGNKTIMVTLYTHVANNSQVLHALLKQSHINKWNVVESYGIPTFKKTQAVFQVMQRGIHTMII